MSAFFVLILHQAVSAINVLLDKADHQYRLLQSHKSLLETLVVFITDHSNEKPDDISSTSSSGQTTGGTTSAAGHSAASGGGSGQPGSSASTSLGINKNIQLMAQKYCGDCRTAFEELSKIIQVSWNGVSQVH